MFLPKQLDNTYRGRKIALYFFFLITTVTIVRSIIHILAPDGGAQSIATIPLDTFTQNGSNTVIHIFSQWGLSQLLMGIMYLIVSIRYKSLVPLMYVFIFIEYTGRLGLGYLKPISTVEVAPGAIINYILIPFSVILFVLSMNRGTRK